MLIIGLNNGLLHGHIVGCCQLILYNIVEPDSVVTILSNIVNKYEQFGPKTLLNSVYINIELVDHFLPCRHLYRVQGCLSKLLAMCDHDHNTAVMKGPVSFK